MPLPPRARCSSARIERCKAGITPDDQPGFPITISRSGRYKLVGNLHVPSGKHGIEAKAASVTIDFNGFTMDGNGTALAGIEARSNGAPRWLTVLNGTITGFMLGGVGAGDYAVIDSMRIVENGGGGGIGLGAYGHVLRSTISANRGTGLACGADCLAESSVISGNTDIGVIMMGGMVLGNTITGNGGYGIAVLGGRVAYGNDTLYGNNKLGNQVGPFTYQLKPNYCDPRC